MRIRDGWISDQTHTILDGLGHEVVGFHCAIEEKLSAIGDPQISWRSESAETGFFRALFGKRRDLLVINHKNFPEYNVLVAARAHGTALHVAWMVLVEPKFTKDVRRAFRVDPEPGTRFEIGSEMDAIDVMDLRAFLGITRLALKHAVRAMTDEESRIEDASSTGAGVE
jgi:hypothetical protein